MVKHVQSEHIRNARIAKRKLLRIGDGIEPRAPDQVRRNNVQCDQLKKARASADFNRNAVRLSKRQQTREKLLIVHAPQNGFFFPNAAMP